MYLFHSQAKLALEESMTPDGSRLIPLPRWQQLGEGQTMSEKAVLVLSVQFWV